MGSQLFLEQDYKLKDLTFDGAKGQMLVQAHLKQVQNKSHREFPGMEVS